MAEELFTPWTWTPPADSVIGKGGFVPFDAYAKIAGTAHFTRDIKRPRMLYAKFYLSPYASAKIKSMDTSAVSAYPGIVDVLRYDDANINWVPPMQPPTVNNQDSVCSPQANYYQQPVGCVVVGESEYVVDEALKLVQIEWEQLPYSIDYTAAMADGATLLRPELNAESNLRQEALTVHGDVEAGFQSCDNVIQFTTTIEEHAIASVEGLADVAEFDENGNCEVWFHGQGFNVALEMAGIIAGSESKVTVHSDYNGGTFGGPISHGIEGWTLWPALIASQRLNRPVKMLWDEAQFLGADEAVGSLDFKIGFNNDGTVVAVDLETNWTGQLIHGDISKIWATSRVPNLRHHYVVPYLNKIIPGVFRDGGLASTCMQIVFTRVAAELSMDPTEIARINDGFEGEDMDWVDENIRIPQGFPAGKNSLEECLAIGKAAIGWDEKWHEPGAKKLANGKYHGMGFQWTEGWMNTPYRNTRAAINVRYDGTADVIYRRADTGPLVQLPYAQVVAAEMGFKMTDVHYNHFRHDVGMDTLSEASSAGVATNVAALVMAARKAKQNILEHAVKDIVTSMFGMVSTTPAFFQGKTIEDLDIKDGMVYEIADPSNTIPVKTVIQAWYGWNPIFMSESSRFFTEAFSETPAYQNSAMGRQCHFVEVEVDPDTGKVDITNLVMVNDVGLVLNPDVVHAQQYGGASMGMGRSNAQEVVYDPSTGVKLNDNLCFYPVYTMNDIGPIDPYLVETGFGYSAYGVSGIGESGSAATMGLTAPAVYNAIGKWTDIPTTPDRVLKALGKA
jgi:xanthine dehydrogenase molybdenum-binding subunit